MRELYPEIDCRQSTQIEVEGGHSLYIEETGNSDGIPVIFLHGGPGSGCNENHRRYFDPDKYRIIIFDQRGCNRSSPQGSVDNNTTQYLLDDIERIRKYFNVESWLVFGGSWGATLALLYAESFPERVLGLITRGTFLARQRDLDWFVGDGANRVFPEYWQEFINPVPEPERNDFVNAYYQRVHGDNADLREKFARAWSDWACRVVTWNLPDFDYEEEEEEGEEDIQKMINEVTIETHYAVNRYFIRDNQILDEIDKLPDVPICIIHGRRDMTCTLESSWLLHRSLPDSEFIIVPDGGHLAGEPPMTNALVSATDRMIDRLQ
ncbi:MAG TPA: prolyl aminopeptidase [Gammaproteobacteria bacterium]|nr:prolyl aminopeptidase [Gammaproteobacteria bacterium]